MSFDWKSLSSRDRAIVGGAAIALIALFLPWYGASVGPLSVSWSGWSAGFTGWAGGLLLTAAGVLVLRRSIASLLTSSGIGPSLLVAAVSALGLLLVIIRWVTFPSYHAIGVSYSVGARYGIYLALIAGLVETTAAVMALRASREQVPWARAEHHPGPAEPGPEAPARPEE